MRTGETTSRKYVSFESTVTVKRQVEWNDDDTRTAPLLAGPLSLASLLRIDVVYVRLFVLLSKWASTTTLFRAADFAGFGNSRAQYSLGAHAKSYAYFGRRRSSRP